MDERIKDEWSEPSVEDIRGWFLWLSVVSCVLACLLATAFHRHWDSRIIFAIMTSQGLIFIGALYALMGPFKRAAERVAFENGLSQIRLTENLTLRTELKQAVMGLRAAEESRDSFIVILRDAAALLGHMNLTGAEAELAKSFRVDRIGAEMLRLLDKEVIDIRALVEGEYGPAFRDVIERAVLGYRGVHVSQWPKYIQDLYYVIEQARQDAQPQREAVYKRRERSVD